METALQLVAEQINEIIGSDDFPARIRPEILKQAVQDYPVHGGKRLRPAILMWSCRMLGGDERQALYPAAALEVWHNWTLVHDDIIDGDCTRRGRPTTHCLLAGHGRKFFQLSPGEAAAHGVNMAILCGDLQQSWANSLMLKSAAAGVAPELVLALLRRLQELAAVELISGEAADVEFAVRPIEEISVNDVIAMIIGKTGALFRAAAEIGAALALGTFQSPLVNDLGRCAEAAGIAFQLRDDLLGTFGDLRTFGKEIGSDLRERKPTVLLMFTLQLAEENDRNAIRAMLGRNDLGSADLAEARRIMMDCGAYDRIVGEAAIYAQRSRDLLENFPDNEYRTLLMKLINYLTSRNR